jgi:hypothetical protein
VNFATFQAWREESVRTIPGLLDCAETNLYRALSALRAEPRSMDADRPVYRCDLARAWLSRYGFDTSESKLALVCSGVRHALTLIFKRLGDEGAAVWIPQDVYPAYGALACAAGIEAQAYATLPEPRIPTARPAAGAEYLLIANPWKPLGRFLTDDECAMLMEWLNGSPQRHLLMDCVYDLGTSFHPLTQKLHETGRAILLHSATKGWLWPETFGVALIGEKHARFRPDFRNDPPSPWQLHLARRFLSIEVDRPAQVVDALRVRASNFEKKLPDAVKNLFVTEVALRTPGCYFFPVNVGPERLLTEHRFLAIPASAFGSLQWHGSILTSLSGIFNPIERGAVL